MKQLLALMAVLIAASVSSADDELVDITDQEYISGRDAAVMVYTRTGKPYKCSGWLRAYDHSGNQFHKVGEFVFREGDKGPQGISLHSDKSRIVSIEYEYSCEPLEQKEKTPSKKRRKKRKGKK